jgi:DNA-binding NarL/FixJ family response regulator
MTIKVSKPRSQDKLSDPVSLWIIDDNKEFCSVLSAALSSSTEIVHTNCFFDGEDAIRMLLTTLDFPSAILLDINMPGMSGIDVLRTMKRLAPDIRIVMLTVNDRDDNIRQAIRLGASGYLLKTSSISQVTNAIFAALRGGITMDPFVIQKMLAMFTRNPGSTKMYRLSKIEKEIIQLTSTGMKTPEIAGKMQVSVHTVRTRFKNIFRKLDVHTRAELTAKSIKENLI